MLCAGAGPATVCTRRLSAPHTPLTVASVAIHSAYRLAQDPVLHQNHVVAAVAVAVVVAAVDAVAAVEGALFVSVLLWRLRSADCGPVLALVLAALTISL